jgi:predicted nucleic acid-binding protein
MLFDTEFLICLGGHRGAAKQKRALAFLDQNPTKLHTSRVCWMEFACGLNDIAAVRAELADFEVKEITEAVAWQASRVARELKGIGLHIGDNDIWIAATARVHGLPLVSNNTRHLGRVTGLDLRSY